MRQYSIGDSVTFRANEQINKLIVREINGALISLNREFCNTTAFTVTKNKLWSMDFKNPKWN